MNYSKAKQAEPDLLPDAITKMNQIYAPYLTEMARVQIFFGGAASGKSYFLAQRAVLDVMAGRNYLVLRNTGRTLGNSVFNQISKTICQLKAEKYFALLKNELTITCLKNNCQILFAGLDDVEKLKSITPRQGVLTDIWIEEATEVAFESYKQLTKRLRGKDEKNLAKRITLSFNPVTKNHWIYKEFFQNWQDNATSYRQKGVSILKTTYADNSFLTPADKAALQEETNQYFYQVYTLGNWGVLGRMVFTNWRVEDLTPLRPGFDRICNGLDFGFADDPNALIRLHLDEKHKTIYIFEEMVAYGMHDDQLAEKLAEIVGTGYITCDSSQPKSIADLNRRGIRALPAVKGPDSILFGLRYLQGFTLVVDPRCQNVKNELQTYCWAEDRQGNTLQKPVDKNNHLMDALRYAVEEYMLRAKAVAVERI